MRQFLLWVFIPFVAVCAAMTFLIPMMQADPGYVLIAVGGKVIEMRFWLAALMFIALFIGLWITKDIVMGTFRFAVASFRWLPAKNQALLWQRQERAMAAMWQGNLREAHRHLVKIAKTKSQQNDVLSLINAANSATDLNQLAEADAFLKRAEAQFDKNHKVQLLLSRARFYQKQNNTQQAQALASQALSQNPLHTGALTLLLNTYRQHNDWSALQTLLPRIKKTQLLNNDDLVALELAIDQGLLANTKDAQQLDALWQSLAKNRRSDTALTTFYIQQLLRVGCDDAANTLLRKLLKNQFSPALIHLFASLKTDDPTANLQYAERWLPEQPNNADLFFALGRIAERGELWGKAKSYFEKSLALQPSPAIYAALANLNAKLGDHKTSASLYQQGLLLSANPEANTNLNIKTNTIPNTKANTRALVVQ